MTTTQRSARLAATLPLVLIGALVVACGQATTNNATTEPAPEAPAAEVADATPVANPEPAAPAEYDGTPVTVWNVTATGGGWSAGASAREAVSAIPGIEQFKMSGTNAAFTVAEGTKVDEAAIAKLFEDKGLEMVSLETSQVTPPRAVYVLAIDGLTWATKSNKVRVALKTLPGIGDAFIDEAITLHMTTADQPDRKAIEKILVDNGATLGDVKTAPVSLF